MIQVRRGDDSENKVVRREATTERRRQTRRLRNRGRLRDDGAIPSTNLLIY